MKTFRLSEKFVAKYKGKQPEWGSLGYFTFKRTYARKTSSGRTEEFWQTCQRVVEGCFNAQLQHCELFRIPWDARKAQISAHHMFKRMWDFKFLPPGRGLWMMGTEYIEQRAGAALNNCGFVSTDQIDSDFSAPFAWVMDMSMLGVGCGYDTKGRHLDLLLRAPRRVSDVHEIPDTREGWVAALRRLLDAFSGRDTLPKEWDFSQIRPEGASIKGFGGISSGSKPLEKMLQSLEEDLFKYLDQQRFIDSTLIVDIMNEIGACVVSGNVRRSAEIAFSEIDDDEFLDLKNYKDFAKEIGNRPRWVSNNSVMAEVGGDYRETGERTGLNGEPGYIWLDNMRAYSRMLNLGDPNYKDRLVAGCNPCGEQSLESFELCCLVETFPANHSSLEDYLTTLRYAYLYAKTVTLIPTHDLRTNAVMMRNRRIGTSQSGIVQNFKDIGRREHFRWCELGYDQLKEYDQRYSDWLCVPKSKKITSVKPSGTVSLLPGATPGIHYPHSEFYVRRIRVGKTSPLWKAMKDAGYKVEPCANQPDTTMIIEFPVHEEKFDRCKTEVSMWEQLENAAQMQAYWADNQVSVTVTFTKEEAKDICYALELYETRLKSVSFLPIEDHGYKQPPYETITEREYKRRVKSLKKPKLNMEVAKEHSYCDGDVCEI